MDYIALQSDVLVALRGSQSQINISKKMRFEFNQVYRWESGRTMIAWPDFIRLCKIYEVDLREALRTCYSYFGKIEDTAALCRHFVGHHKISEFAEAIEMSRSSLSRWMSGKGEPHLIQLMKIMQLGSIDFYRFLETLTNFAKLPTIEHELQIEREHMTLYDRFPWLSVLLSALTLGEYKSTPTMAFLAQKARLPVESVKEAIEALSTHELLKWNGHHWETQLHRISMRPLRPSPRHSDQRRRRTSPVRRKT